MNKEEILKLRLEGLTYGTIADKAGVSRQRVQQILSPPSEIRKFVVAKYRGKCSNCGILVGQSGHIHHKDSTADEYNDINHLELLCIGCHRKVHSETLDCKRNEKAEDALSKTMGKFMFTCRACSYRWLPRTEHPVRCPKCQSRNYNKKKEKKV
jgi:Zn finger protein HypA/HybF involved in hydrogenase expression